MVEVKMYFKSTKAILLSLLLWFGIQRSFCQLKINDVCPNVAVVNVINYNNRTMELNDFKSKAIIIVFWSTRCLSCLQEFPIIDSLQKKFQKEVQFILVTKEEKKTVQDFFEQHRKVKIPDVPIVTADTKLHKLFPSAGYPYSVWMNPSRVINQLTGGYNITKEHIERFLSGSLNQLRYSAVKTVYKPLWKMTDSLIQNKLDYFSCITPCIAGLDMGTQEGSSVNDGTAIQLGFNCYTIIDLFKKAFGENGRYAVNTGYGIEIALDSTLFTQPEDRNLWDKWEKKHLFNYALVLPAEKRNLLYQAMQQDLLRYFNIEAIRLKKKIKGFALIELNGKKPFTKGGVPSDAYNNQNIETVDSLQFINQPVSRLNDLLIYWLGYYYPIKNETKENCKLDFCIRKSSIQKMNIDELRKDLEKSNLDLKEVWIETDVLEIKAVQ